MAKPPETRDRFQLIAEVDAEAMGPLLAQLTRMGLQNISYELITDVHTFASRPRKDHGSSAEEFASAWIAEHPTFKVEQLCSHFQDNGRSRSTGHYIARKLTKSGKITDLGNGNYRASHIKAIAPPTGADASKISNRALIWQAIGRRQKFKTADIAEVFKAAGRNMGSASSVLTKMQKAGEIARAGDAEYAVVSKPETPAKRSRRPNPVTHYDVSNLDLIMEAIRHRKSFRSADLVEIFKDKGRNPKSVSPMITRLRQNGTIRQIEPGTYEVLNKNPKGDTA